MNKKINITCQGSSRIDLNKLSIFQGDLKEISEENLNKLKKSILKHGFSFPVFVWDNNIIDGTHRMKALKALIQEGYAIGKIPIVNIDAKDKKEAAEKLLALNNHYAKFTDDGLLDFANSFELDLKDLELDLPDIDIDSLIPEEENSHNTGDDEIPEEVEQICHLGDLWKLGDHRLLCGDSTKKEDVERLIDGKKVDMVFTDPPYGIKRDKGFKGAGGFKGKGKKIKKGAGGFKGKGKKIKRRVYEDDDWDSSIPDSDFFDFIINISDKALIFGGNFFAHLLPQSKHWIVWDKKNTMPTFGDAELIWTNIKRNSVKIKKHEFNGLIGKEQKRYHPTQKPLKLIRDIIKDYSEDKNFVLDPFLGSGSTLIACEKTNRICYGMEIAPKYCDIIIKRWEDYTSNKAEKIL